MATYRYRDAREARLTEVLDTLPPEPGPFRTLLETELAAIAPDSWLVTDETYQAVTQDWLLTNSDPVAIRELIRLDPLLEAAGTDPQLTEAQALGIVAIPVAPAGQAPQDYLANVLTAVDGEQAVLDQIIEAAHQGWLAQAAVSRQHPFDDIGVLLPIRIETMFDPPVEPTREVPNPPWRLRLRIIPDEASICRDSAYLTDDERKALTVFWQAVQQPGVALSAAFLDGDHAAVAWKLLADKTTPQRAAWLVSAFQPVLDGNDVTLETPDAWPRSPGPNWIDGFPSRIHVFAELNSFAPGDFPEHIGSLPENPDAIIDRSNLTLSLPRSENEEDAWWSSWATARKVGLASWQDLPAGYTPDTIRTLFVVGIGEDAPGEHFAAQIQSGDFSLLQLGTPTNSIGQVIPGTPASGPHDWLSVARARLDMRLNPGVVGPGAAGSLAVQYLSGIPDSFPAFPNGHLEDECLLSQSMTSALWPVLWGHWLRDIWGMEGGAYWIGTWMQRYFAPEGPLMPIRIGDQPYGLLPATALNDWQWEATTDPDVVTSHAVLDEVRSALITMRDEMARIARNDGNVVGTASDRFVELLGAGAASTSYAWRFFAPAMAFMIPFNTGDPHIGDQAAREFYQIITDRYPQAVPRPFVTQGYWGSSDLPLVQPNRLMFGHVEGRERVHVPIKALLEAIRSRSGLSAAELDLDKIYQGIWKITERREGWYSILPDALLFRLLVNSAQLATRWRQEPAGGGSEEFNVIHSHELAADAIADCIDKKAWVRREPDPLDGQDTFIPDMPSDKRLRLEQAFRATVDSSSKRIDPWVTSFAWQRLSDSSRSERRMSRLGVYGWVDGPFSGTPGPTRAGLIHTPSQAQTLASLIMRDKFISSSPSEMVSESGANPWQFNITSDRARLAQEIADEVRLGFHLHEVIGRMVEDIIVQRLLIQQLRTDPAYAMHKDRCDRNEVCNGLAAFPALIADTPFPVSEGQRVRLRRIGEALDTYGDLLIADGVMQVIDHQVDRAAETMDAAAGLSRPPTFQFLQTPPSGYRLESAVVSVFPVVGIDDPRNANHPVRLADPSVAAFIEARFAEPWTWTVDDPGGGGVAQTVTLDDLDLSVADALTLPPDLLEGLVLATLQAEAGQVTPPRQHQLAQHLMAALANRPAIGSDLISQADQATIRQRQLAVDTAIYADLLTRYTAVHTACTQVRDDLAAAATDSECAVALRRALSWGAIPASQPADRAALLAALAGVPLPAESTPLATLCTAASATLTDRLKRLPDPTTLAAPSDITKPLPDHTDKKLLGTPDGIQSLAHGIANLASPGIKLAVTATWPTATLLAETELQIAAADADLDEQWLTVVAAPRAGLARLEAVQLELDTPLPGWSSSPGDPWRTAEDHIIRANLKQREETSVANFDTRRFVAAYGEESAWNGAEAAIGLIDSFGEAIPMPQRSTGAAFGFNAPAARPPQAILLAVPPTPRQLLDERVVVQIVKETRLLALARAPEIEDLGQLQAVIPTAWLQWSGPTRVHLEPRPLYNTV